MKKISVIDWLEIISQNQELKAKIQSTNVASSLVNLAAEQGYEISEAEVQELLSNLVNASNSDNVELDQTQLETVAGGLPNTTYHPVACQMVSQILCTLNC